MPKYHRRGWPLPVVTIVAVALVGAVMTTKFLVPFTISFGRKTTVSLIVMDGKVQHVVHMKKDTLSTEGHFNGT